MAPVRRGTTRRPRVRRLKAPFAAAVMAMALAACGTAPPSSLATARIPLAAGKVPSTISKMVCSPKARSEIGAALGVTAVVTAPTWSAHLYSCRYTYPDGYFTLSVKELSSWNETYSYFRGIGSALGDVNTLPNLGQGGFSTRDGSVAVRKDWKVLLVDISGIPAQFGQPPTPSGNVAVTVADVILGCWSGD